METLKKQKKETEEDREPLLFREELYLSGSDEDECTICYESLNRTSSTTVTLKYIFFLIFFLILFLFYFYFFFLFFYFSFSPIFLYFLSVVFLFVLKTIYFSNHLI